MYQALYRKYRPKTFDDVIGQKHITESLKNQVRTGHLSHAYIFIGTRGTGKTTCARILAKAVNCENTADGNPCLECKSCKGIEDGSVLDIVELDAASNNGVDNVRILRDEAVFTPANVRKRVYIIDEVHMLSTPAFNALLKILEEPPEHLIFILATTEIQKVPATILSRCQRHAFRRIDNAELAAYLLSIAEKEKLELEKDAAELIASLAEGSVRDALSMLDQCSSTGHIDIEAVYSSVGLAGNRLIEELLRKIAARDTEGAVSDFGRMWNDGKDPAVALKELCTLSRDVLLTKVAPKSAKLLSYGGYGSLDELADMFTVRDLADTIDTLQKAAASMRDRLSPRTTAELAIIRLCEGIAETGAPLQRSAAPKTAENPARQEEKHMPAPAAAKTAFQTRPAPQEPAAPPAVKEGTAETLPAVPAAGSDSFWEEVCGRVDSRVPIFVRLEFGKGVTGFRDGKILHIDADSDFILDQLNKPEVKQAFADASGLAVNVYLKEKEVKAQGNLDDLMQFSEVKFT